MFMSMFNDFIQAIGLDSSFFYQLLLAVALYFILKNLFFQPYLESFEKRQKLTKGRMKASRELEKKIAEQKSFYEKRAKFVHNQFQKIFSEIKQKAQENYLNESVKFQKEQKDLIAKEKSNLKLAFKEQDVILQKDLPDLVKLLVKKVRG